MKPRIRKWHGLWECFMPPRGRTAYGYTPLMAFTEWKRLTGGRYA
jgi:hypothetical protein